MTAPDMATVTESLERSMQNCSLSNRRGIDAGGGESSASCDNINATTDEHIPISDRTLELNSHISLPCHWEQCLDLKTGEIYYINWKNGMKVKEDPRRGVMRRRECSGGESYVVCSEEDSSYDSEESTSESKKEEEEDDEEEEEQEEEEEEEGVLVVAGCKACFMYFMVPKLVEDCPKCSAHLIHFDRSDTASP